VFQGNGKHGKNIGEPNIYDKHDNIRGGHGAIIGLIKSSSCQLICDLLVYVGMF
jgi:hypothetical protein